MKCDPPVIGMLKLNTNGSSLGNLGVGLFHGGLYEKHSSHNEHPDNITSTHAWFEACFRPESHTLKIASDSLEVIKIISNGHFAYNTIIF